MVNLWVTFLAVLVQFHTLSAGALDGSASCSCGQPGKGQPSPVIYDIFSGLNTSSPGRWCWQVALQSDSGSIFCSAILVDRFYAITPAQCIFGRQANTTFLRTGSFDLSATEAGAQVLAVERLLVNQGYLNVDTSSEFNIGIIKLQTPVDCSSGSVCTACLPAPNAMPLTNQASCVATTWNIRATSSTGGKTVPRPMRERAASIMEQINCEMAIHSDGAIQSDYRLADSKFCLREATNISSCMGDLGDPLVCLNSNTSRYELVGLNTIGFSCFRPNLPSFYVRVSSFVDWISKVIDTSATARSIPATFTIPDSAKTIIIQPVAVVPVVVVPANQSAQVPPVQNSTTTTTAAAVSVQNTTAGPMPIVMPVSPVVVQPPTPSSIGSANPQVSANRDIVINPSMFNTQRMGADGSLQQIGPDGSVQRQNPLPTTSLLQQVAPGVFRTNVGSGFVQISPTGSQFVFPTAGAVQPMQPITRQKRDNILASGIIAPNSSSGNLNVPTINVAASDVSYDANTGKFEFRLPQGNTAYSSVSFVPSSVDDIKSQIIAQQDKILAQVDNFKRNILISISGNFPQFSPSSGSSSSFQGSSGADASSASISKGAGSNVLSGASSNSNSRIAPAPKAAVVQPGLSQADDDYEDTDIQPASISSPAIVAPVSQSGGSSVRPSGIVSSASAGGVNNVQTGLTSNGGFRTVVNNQAPSAGSLHTSFKSSNSQGDAAIGFQGARVQGETRHAPGSSSSAVFASSSRK